MDGPLPMAMEVASTRLPGLGSWELGGGCRENLGGAGMLQMHVSMYVIAEGKKFKTE